MSLFFLLGKRGKLYLSVFRKIKIFKYFIFNPYLKTVLFPTSQPNFPPQILPHYRDFPDFYFYPPTTTGDT